MAQKSQQQHHKGQASAAVTDIATRATPTAQPKAPEGKSNAEELGRIVQLFKEMPAHYKDEIRKELGASGIVRQKRRHRATNESAASLVHTAGDVIHPEGHMATAPEWVYEKGDHFVETWERRWDEGRPFITEGNLAFEYDENEFTSADMVGELAPTG